MDDRINSRKLVLLLLAIFILTVAIYLPGLSGNFVFDSRTNISSNEALQLDALDLGQLWQAALSNRSGPFGRPIPVVSFALNHIISGPSPYGYKLTNVLIHSINGLLIFFLTLKLLGFLSKKRDSNYAERTNTWIALFVAAAWLLHPINLTNVLYVVQRMNSMSALFTLAGILSYTIGRCNAIDGKQYFATTFVIPTLCIILAVLSKENGALLPAFLFIIEFTIFNFQTKTTLNKNLLRGYYVVSLLIPAIALLVFFTTHPEWATTNYQSRDFSLGERLLTEARVLWFYIGLILIPDNTSYGLFHDDIITSKNLLQPITTLLSIFALITILLTAVFYRTKARIFSLGILFFLTGHLLESTIVPIEIAYEHRNYLPSYGILLGVFYYLLHPKILPEKKSVKHAIAALSIVMLLTTTLIRSLYWGNMVELSIAEQAHHPESPRANIMLGIQYGLLAEANPGNSDQYFEKAKILFLKESGLSPTTTSGLFQLIIFSSILGKNIDAAWTSTLMDRLENTPFRNNNVNLINAVILCQLEKRCSFPDEVVIKLIQATLKNSSAKGMISAELYTMASKYYLIELKDLENALFLISSAAEAAPKILRYRVHLIKLLIALNRIDDASEEINKVENLDHVGREKNSIRLLKKAMHDARTNQNIRPQ